MFLLLQVPVSPDLALKAVLIKAAELSSCRHVVENWQ